MSKPKEDPTLGLDVIGPTGSLFCLELGSEDGSDRYYFVGAGSQFDFEKKCNDLMPEAARIALENDQKGQYHFVCWENIIEILAGLLPKHGYKKLEPKVAYYRRGMLNPITADAYQLNHWPDFVKEGLAGSYELLGEWGPKITEHNLKHQDDE